MSTKQHQDTDNVYNQGSMNQYNSFQGALGNFARSAVANPLASSYFKNQWAQQQAQVNQLAGNQIRNNAQNLRTGGGLLGNAPGVSAAMMNRAGIGTNLMKGNAFNGALNNALNMRNYGAGIMASYNPLQTGQRSTSYSTGAGTWAGPLIGAAMNIAAPGIGGMLSGAGFMGGMKSAFGGGAPTSGAMTAPSGGGGFQMSPQMSAQMNPFQQYAPAYN
jgi:hypothetical protein